MKKYTIILLFLTLCTSMQTFSQLRDSLTNVYTSQTIYRSGSKYVKGNEKLSYENLALQFNRPSTQEMYKKSKRKIFISRIFNVASLAIIITSVFTKTSTAGSIEFATGTGILGLGSLHYQTQANRLIENALWLRNREVLMGAVPN